MKTKKNVYVFLLVILKLTLDILELLMKSKKNLRCFLNGSFLSSFVGGGHSFFNFIKGDNWKKSLVNPAV